jgi:hypothetical protein
MELFDNSGDAMLDMTEYTNPKALAQLKNITAAKADIEAEEETCEDTAGWTNGKDWEMTTCQNYVDEGCCSDGKVDSKCQIWQGYDYSYPENNCCACGKGSKSLEEIAE